jgi:hypothetical protein
MSCTDITTPTGGSLKLPPVFISTFPGTFSGTRDRISFLA